MYVCKQNMCTSSMHEQMFMYVHIRFIYTHMSLLVLMHFSPIDCSQTKRNQMQFPSSTCHALCLLLCRLQMRCSLCHVVGNALGSP